MQCCKSSNFHQLHDHRSLQTLWPMNYCTMLLAATYIAKLAATWLSSSMCISKPVVLSPWPPQTRGKVNKTKGSAPHDLRNNCFSQLKWSETAKLRSLEIFPECGRNKLTIFKTAWTTGIIRSFHRLGTETDRERKMKHLSLPRS